MSAPPNFRLNVNVPFPALVQGSGPITISKNSGIWTVGYGVTQFATGAPPGSLTNDYVLVWDSVGQTFVNVSLATLLSSGGGATSPTFDTLAAFLASGIASAPYVNVRTVTGTFPPAAGFDATPMTYRAVSSTTGLFGEVTVSGQLYAPLYSTNPVQVGQFGVIGDANYAQAAAYVTATANGTATLTTASTAGLVNGMNVANISWHSFAAAAIGSAGVIPPGTTLVSFVPNTSITLSNAIVAGSNLALVAWSETLTGTDNTAAIQASLDFALQNKYADVKFPSGKFLVSDTLNAGWGDTFYEIHLIGNRRASYGGIYAGTVLFSTKTDRPLLSIAGARAISVQGLTLIGRNKIFAQFSQWFNNVLSSDPLDWMSPAINPTGSNPGGIQSTAPYCGIAQDAYAAVQPTIHYPNRTFPAWTGLSSNYSASMALSSEILIEDCDIEGFGVQIVSGLVNDLQGDFLKIARFVTQAGPYGISINNNQSRNVELRNIDYAGFHTLFSCTNLGKADGEIVGPFDNIGGGGSYQAFDFQSMGFCGPVTIDNLYFENQVRLGNFVANQAFSAPVIISGGKWSFQEGVSSTTIPASLITSGPFGYIRLYCVEMIGNPRIANLVMGGGGLTMDGVTWLGALVTNTSAPLIQAVNYTGGFLLGDVRFNTTTRDVLSVISLLGTNFTGIGSGSASQVFGDEINFRNSSLGVPTRTSMTQCAKNYTDSFGRRWKMTVTPEFTTGVGAFGSGPTYSNDQMSFGWPTANQTATNVMENLAPGDMLYHVNTGTLFVVTAVGAPAGGNYPITTIQQNNLLVNASNVFVANLNPSPSLAAGNIIIIKTGAVIPSVLEYGTFTSGNPNVASISDGSGTSHMASNYVNGDIFFGLPTSISGSMPYRQWPVTPGSVLSAVTDGAPGTLTLSHNALASGVFPLFPYELT